MIHRGHFLLLNVVPFVSPVPRVRTKRLRSCLPSPFSSIFFPSLLPCSPSLPFHFLVCLLSFFFTYPRCNFSQGCVFPFSTEKVEKAWPHDAVTPVALSDFRFTNNQHRNLLIVGGLSLFGFDSSLFSLLLFFACESTLNESSTACILLCLFIEWKLVS